MNENIEIFVNKEQFEEFIQNNTCSILLGNGFSCNYHENFNSKNILSTVKRNWYPSDFIKKLLDIRTKIDTYDSLETTWKDIKEHFNELFGSALGDVIVQCHRDIHTGKSIWNKEKNQKLVNILIFFEKIFTTNYDLILPWIIPDIKHAKDGFNASNNFKWEYKDTQNIFWLHGSLHICRYKAIEPEYEICKLTKNDNPINPKTLLENIEYMRSININEFVIEHAVFFEVFGGTNEDKQNIINNNPYLSYCYSQLKQITTPLVIYGCSIAKNDNHIWSAIDKNTDIDTVYVSIYNNDMTTKINAKQFLSNKKILFFDSDIIKPTQ